MCRKADLKMRVSWLAAMCLILLAQSIGCASAFPSGPAEKSWSQTIMVRGGGSEAVLVACLEHRTPASWELSLFVAVVVLAQTIFGSAFTTPPASPLVEITA